MFASLSLFENNMDGGDLSVFLFRAFGGAVLVSSRRKGAKKDAKKFCCLGYWQYLIVVSGVC